MRFLARCVAAGMLFVLAGCGMFRSEEPYALPDTAVLDFPAKAHAQEYKLYVSLPRNYEKRTAERFPVIYLLDADYAFALTHSLQRHFTDRGLEREAIIVGIAYPGAESDMDVYYRTRTFDYTPSASPYAGYDLKIQLPSGGGPAFLKVLADEIVPEIDRRYRTVTAERMLVGNSYGGLFATYAMLVRPGLFSQFLIVSPSLWYDQQMIFGVAKDYIAVHRALPAQVFFAVGSFENEPPPSLTHFVDDLNKFCALMKSANLSGYQQTMVVFDSENHQSLFPAALSRGLRVLAGFKGETQLRSK